MKEKGTVMLRLIFPRKTSLVFVIRDKTRIPLEYLEPVLREDIEKIWDSVPKPEAHKHTLPSEFFNVQVVALSSYEDKEEQFKEQVASLRQKFFQSITTGGLAGDRRGVVPASGFSFSAQHIWKIIKENKDLDLAAHNVMVATVQCEEIANEKYSSFAANKDWLELQEAALSQLVPGFGKKLSSLLYNCLSSYDEEATYFEDGVRYVKRKHLVEKLMQLVQPAYQLMLERILPEIKKALNNALNGRVGFAVATRECVKEFMRLFDEEYAINQAFWDSANLREQFSCDLNSHIAVIRTAKLSEVTSLYESEIKEASYGSVEALLVKSSDDTWPAISNLLHQETAKAVSRFSFAISDFGIEKQEKEDFISNLKNYSRELVEAKAREEAGKVLYHMKERFTSIFKHDEGSMPRVWTGKEDIQETAKTGQYESLKLLSMLAAIRLNEETDTITETLVLSLMDPKIDNSKSTTLHDPLASSTWEEVPATRTLITPVECKSLWNQCRKETECVITQAIASQNMAPMSTAAASNRKRGREVESTREVVRQLPQIRYRKKAPGPRLRLTWTSSRSSRTTHCYSLSRALRSIHVL
ncbi:protein ROOT HAIR DEFECTIVE 3 homolog 1-like [Bidens hawaiensis]|uniref:protein ROOT HAIR DEFECTIVE 3 homolog 1-like n=1 Tax=Bidens hawaiensis TaxID=980011 RepID=UPI0040494E68